MKTFRIYKGQQTFHIQAEAVIPVMYGGLRYITLVVGGETIAEVLDYDMWEEVRP